MNWGLVIVIALAVMVVFFILKFKEMRHKVGFLVILFLVMFLGLTFANIYFKSHVDLTTFDGVVTASKLYVAWLVQVGDNIVKVSGYVINQDWGIKEDPSAVNQVQEVVVPPSNSSVTNITK